MRGRYTRRGSMQWISESFRALPTLAELPLPDENYSVAPTTFQLIIRQRRDTGERELVLAR